MHVCVLVSGLTSVAEQLRQQRVGRRDHCRGLGRQLVEQSSYGGHSVVLCSAQPCCCGQTGQVAWQRHRAQYLEYRWVQERFMEIYVDTIHTILIHIYIYIYTHMVMKIAWVSVHALCSWLQRPPELFRNMTLCGCRAREMAAVTSVGSSITEHPRLSLPTGQTNGIVPQSRVHWRRLVSTATYGGALMGRRGWAQGQGDVREKLRRTMSVMNKKRYTCVCQKSSPSTVTSSL